MTDGQFVEELIQAAYTVGILKGRREDRSPHQPAAVAQAQIEEIAQSVCTLKKLRQEILRRLKERTEHAKA